MTTKYKLKHSNQLYDNGYTHRVYRSKYDTHLVQQYKV